MEMSDLPPAESVVSCPDCDADVDWYQPDPKVKYVELRIIHDDTCPLLARLERGE